MFRDHTDFVGMVPFFDINTHKEYILCIFFNNIYMSDTSPESRKISAVAQKEQEILKFWDDNQIFQKSLEKKSPQGEFTFYDGPPFATGLPHFGHMLPGTIKDAIPRYKTMNGYHVRRQWGWDCHGLPIEKLIQEENNLKTKKDIEDFGIKNFNQAAKASVFKYDQEWKQTIPRTGRWVDMETPYTTMDSSFTESVWWGFNQLQKKGLVYESFKVMHVSPLLETTLSNFEVNQAYKDITDISATVKFQLQDQKNTFILAWTTTPWTLPANVALAVGKDVTYVKIKHEDNLYILASDLVEKNFKDKPYEIVEEFIGQELVGKSYKPVFEYYAKDSSIENYANGWKIYAGDFVTTTDGTGVVHIAPAFGEDDLTLAKEFNLPFVQHVKMNGEIKEEITELAGKQAKPKHNPQETDIEVIKMLAHQGSLFSKEKYIHSYPHCWRTDAPLLNYATSSWFIKVTDLKESLVKNNDSVKWVPEAVGAGRFGNWLKDAKDWAISRSRFWGTPMPIWKSEDGKDVRFISSLEDLKQKTKSSNTYFVLRHGEAEHNVKNIASDSNNTPSHLTEVGRSQIAKVAEQLKSETFDFVFVSPLIRTQETAQIIKQNLCLKDEQVITDERIREVQTGFDGKSINEYRNFFQTISEKFEKKHADGETLVHLKKRVGEFLYEIDSKYSNKKILIISHEYPIWMLFAIKDGLTKKQTIELKESVEEFVSTGELKSLEFAKLPHDDNFELDFHRPYIDEITFEENGKVFKRIDAVFDTWIDSGSMPFASAGYPFKKDTFKPGTWFSKSKGFPADFIAEGLDQTRGWFYTLLVWSTSLFGKAPYKHVVVNGLVLAEDGKKMSKSLKNYTPLPDVIDMYGADSLRYFLLSSPAVKADDVKFSEKLVDEVMKKIVMRLDNVISFYEMYKDDIIEPSHTSSHILDKWIIARLHQTIQAITNGFEKYELDKASRPLMDFVDDLSTWYLRRSRDRFKSQNHDTNLAVATMRYVLREFAKVMAPVMPFKAEDTYLRVRTSEDQVSVHLCDWPKVKHVDESIIIKMSEARTIVTRALELRTRENIKVRQPLQTLEIKIELDQQYLEIIKDEINVKEVEINKTLETDVWLDTSLTPELIEEGIARELIRTLQDLRKANNLSPEDTINLTVSCSKDFEKIIESHIALIKQVTRTASIVYSTHVETEPVLINEFKIALEIQKI
jgi:isoleucyl-tRNA synthetase